MLIALLWRGCRRRLRSENFLSEGLIDLTDSWTFVSDWISKYDWHGWVYLTCGLTTTTGRDGMGYIITAIYMKHDTINNQPTKETRCKQQQQYTPDTLFMMIPPSFEKDNVFFFWMD